MRKWVNGISINGSFGSKFSLTRNAMRAEKIYLKAQRKCSILLKAEPVQYSELENLKNRTPSLLAIPSDTWYTVFRHTSWLNGIHSQALRRLGTETWPDITRRKSKVQNVTPLCWLNKITAASLVAYTKLIGQNYSCRKMYLAGGKTAVSVTNQQSDVTLWLPFR